MPLLMVSGRPRARYLAPASDLPDAFPRLGSYCIGGTRRHDLDAYIDEAARRHVNINGDWPGWEIGKTRTRRQISQLVRSRSSINSKLFSYIIFESLHKQNISTGQPMWPIYNHCQTNGLWAYLNGLTETTQVDSYNSSFFQINHSTSGKTVAGKKAYQWIIDWYKSWLVDGATINDGVSNLTNGINPDLDGIFFDNFFPYFKSPQADMDRNGTVDNYAGAASIALAQTSNAAAADYYRTIMPGKLLLGNSAEWHLTSSVATLANKLNGGVIEGGIGQTYSMETHTSFQSYINHIATQMDNYAEPKYGVVVNILDSLTNYALMRYQLTACLMTNAYFHTSLVGLQTQNMGAAWYDEFDFDLGQPVPGPDGAVQTAPRYQVGSNGEGIWRRDFENGIALNRARRPNFTSTTAYAAQPLGGTFRALSGSQDPSVNNGATITSLPAGLPRTGMVLIRT
jgi:hypothetical protein